MHGIRLIALLAAATLVGCGSFSGPDAVAGASATDVRHQPVNGFRTAASDVFRNERAAPPFEGYISGR